MRDVASRIVANATKLQTDGGGRLKAFGTLDPCADPELPSEARGKIKPGSIKTRIGKEAELYARGHTADELAKMDWSAVRARLKQ